MKVMEALKQWADQTGINEHDLVDDYDLYAHAEEMRRELESLVLVRAINNSDHLDYIKALLAATAGAGEKPDYYSCPGCGRPTDSPSIIGGKIVCPHCYAPMTPKFRKAGRK